VVELDDGSLCLNCRVDRLAWEAAWPVGEGQSPRRRLAAWSWDGGRTFFDHRLDEALVDPHCQGSLLRVPSSPGRQGSCVLFSNLASESAREKLTIRVSFDGCRTWPLARCLDPGPSAYSDLGMTPDGSILCLYETKPTPGETAATPYSGIRLARFDLEWFAAKQQASGQAEPRQVT
jgi:sialidase-1